MPFSSGQWALYKLTKGGGPPSFVMYRILGEEAGAFWWEMESVGYVSLAIFPAYVNLQTGKPVQLDGLFVRNSPALGN